MSTEFYGLPSGNNFKNVKFCNAVPNWLSITRQHFKNKADFVKKKKKNSDTFLSVLKFPTLPLRGKGQLEMLDFSKFPCRFPQRLSLHAGVFPNPKSKNYSRTSSLVIPLRMHEGKSLSFHFRFKGFGFGLNNSLCKTS